MNAAKKLNEYFTKESLSSWFDLGLALDRLHETSYNKTLPTTELTSIRAGIVNFDFGIDGVTIEVDKYIESLISMGIKPEQLSILTGKVKHNYTPPSQDIEVHAIASATSFNEWDGYELYFQDKLERGSEKYNKLFSLLIKDCKKICSDMADIIDSQEINFLILANTNSNPGNVSLAMATTIISEILGLPVLNICHDFYWESGSKKIPGKSHKDGIRDHFFTNAAVGEVFAPIETLYPWQGKHWHHAVINNYQQQNLITQHGANPNSISLLSTSINTDQYYHYDASKKKESRNKLEQLFKKYDCTETVTPSKYLESMHSNTNFTPICLSTKTQPLDFQNSYIALQPTRILERKAIEKTFAELRPILTHLNHKKMIFLVSGPIATGQKNYYRQLITTFDSFCQTLSEEQQNRIILAFRHGCECSDVLLMTPELYGAADLVTLMSTQEGRGLPILEACAAGLPIICNQYSPIEVYSQIIGKHLPESLQLKTFEPSADESHDSRSLIKIGLENYGNSEHAAHNRRVVQKRFGHENFVLHFREKIEACLKDNTKPDIDVTVATALELRKTREAKPNSEILLDSHRQYMPGVNILEYMSYLKSLIDPSFFRTEERELRGRIFNFINKWLATFNATPEQKTIAYDHIETFLSYHAGENSLAIDHSFSYRHRNRHHFPYRWLTETELKGALIKGITNNIKPELTANRSNQETINFHDFKIDCQPVLDCYFKVVSPSDIIWLLGPNLVSEANFIKDLFKQYDLTPRIHVFVKEHSIDTLDRQSATKLLAKHLNPETYDIISYDGVSCGTHLHELPQSALQVFNKVSKEGSLVVGFGDHNFFTTDLLSCNRLLIGKVNSPHHANFFGISNAEQYKVFLPPGVRSTLCYPTPTQNTREYANELNYRVNQENILEIFQQLTVNAKTAGNPIKEVLAKQDSSAKPRQAELEYQLFNGLHADGSPWNGAYAKIKLSANLTFSTQFAQTSNETVINISEHFQKKSESNVLLAWNGGYILNPELVGKLGLPEKHIGTPLGLLIKNGEIKSLPLFNKPALLFHNNGSVSIKPVNLDSGFKLLFSNGKDISFDSKMRNNPKAKGSMFFDLMYEEKQIDVPGHAVLIAGDKILDIKKNNQKPFEQLPVGITLILRDETLVESLNIGDQVHFVIDELKNIASAVEAGPLLVKDGDVSIEMQGGGWKTEKSIKTQAARVDYIDMRGPKIGVGLADSGELIVAAINGRIIESVGATHQDLAKILIGLGANNAMGFDPGGSVTLVAEGKQLNITPYNNNYESNPYALPPRPRFVGNAILAYKKKFLKAS